MCLREEQRELLDGARLPSEPTGVRAGCEHRAEAEAGVGSKHLYFKPR